MFSEYGATLNEQQAEANSNRYSHTGNIVRTNFGRAAIGGKTPLPTPPHHHPVTTLTIVTAYDMI